MERAYIAIDLKSFYASVECNERHLDPLRTNLVVADESRTEKTICLAVSPSLKSYGIAGRARLFEVVQRIKEVNSERLRRAPNRAFTGESSDAAELALHPEYSVSYITAPPRMGHYMDYSTKIYRIYMKYVSPEDIHVYSIDEVFIDATQYLSVYKCTARELAMRMIRDVLGSTGITATAGIGTNMYLCKIAMDIVAKHIPADADGVRIAELDEMSYRRMLWCHRPLTDFWRVGRGYMKKLEDNGFFTMGDIARASLDKRGEDTLYKLFGVNAELLIDHAWGWEPCPISEIKAYKPEENSLSTGQVLKCPYNYEKTRLIIREMTDLLVLDLVEKRLVTDRISLTVGYDIECLTDPEISRLYKGPVTTDFYGRRIPKEAHGTAKLPFPTSSTRIILDEMTSLFDRIFDRNLLSRRMSVAACRLIDEAKADEEREYCQIEMFTDEEENERKREKLEREKKRQLAMISIKKKYGKNAIIKGMNLEEGATTIERNGQIGGHKA